MNAQGGIIVYSDQHDLLVEILGQARKLADQQKSEVSVVLIGEQVSDTARQFLDFGADNVFIVEGPGLKSFEIEMFTGALQGIVAERDPDVVLIGSSKNGKPLAARLATRLNVGCVPDCTSLTRDDKGRLVGERITYGGNAIATVTLLCRPQIVTIPSRAFEKPQPQQRNGKVVKLEVKVDRARTETVEIGPLETSSVRIEDARVIVSCGRGLMKKDDRKMLDELAVVMCGQVGCSRPLAEDRKWFSEWIGLSGHKVKPNLYMACGLSGVIQHAAGIRDAKVIVAINKDPQAPIFEIADYGVIADLYKFLPLLKETLAKQLE